MKHFLMKPPKWLKRILERFPSYRGWFIKQVCIMLREDAMKSYLNEHIAKQKKTGRWIVLEYCANEGIYCSECHMKIFNRITKPKKKLSQYCPHCGSRNDQFFREGEVVFR